MNKRIRELAEQAKKHAIDAMIKIADREQALKVYSESYDTKFAELIVRECANICDAKRAEYTKLSKDADSFKDKNLWAEGEISAHRIRISIQEHFGVKE
jgi:hypothetical protein